jgi:hypothetical protein
MDLKLLQDFKSNLICFFDELIEQFPSESQFVLCRILIKDQVTPEFIINYFITNVLPHKGMIKNRDERFFTELNVIYFGLTENSSLKKIWIEKQLDEEDKDVIWKWIDLFVAMCEKYKKHSH